MITATLEQAAPSVTVDGDFILVGDLRLAYAEARALRSALDAALLDVYCARIDAQHAWSKAAWEAGKVRVPDGWQDAQGRVWTTWQSAWPTRWVTGSRVVLASCGSVAHVVGSHPTDPARCACGALLPDRLGLKPALAKHKNCKATRTTAHGAPGGRDA